MLFIRANRIRAVTDSFTLSVSPSVMNPFVSGFPAMTPQAFYNSWSTFFYNPKIPASFSYINNKNSVHELHVGFGEGASVPQFNVTSSEGGISRSVLFERKIDGKSEDPIEVNINQSGQMFYNRAASEFGPPLYLFQSTSQFSETDNVTWFSNLRMNSLAHHVV